jgi:hypothetical protein
VANTNVVNKRHIAEYLRSACWRILVAQTRRLSDPCSDNDQLRAGRQHPGYPGLEAMALT